MDSTVLIFTCAGFNLLLIPVVAFFCSSKFESFAGFNGLDFHIRWIQLVVVFLVTFFVAFAVILFVHRNVFAFEDYLNTALRLALVSLDSTVLIFTFAGFNLLLIPVVAFFVVMGRCCSSVLLGYVVGRVCQHCRCSAFHGKLAWCFDNTSSNHKRM